MEITEDIKESLNVAVSRAGSVYQFSQKIGISSTTVARWISGETKAITNKMWMQTVYPALRPYLKIDIPTQIRESGSKKYTTILNSPEHDDVKEKFSVVMTALINTKLSQLTYAQVMQLIAWVMEKLPAEELIAAMNVIDQMIEDSRAAMAAEAMSAREKAGIYAAENKSQGERK